jgi:hypothetical protein
MLSIPAAVGHVFNDNVIPALAVEVEKNLQISRLTAASEVEVDIAACKKLLRNSVDRELNQLVGSVRSY